MIDLDGIKIDADKLILCRYVSEGSIACMEVELTDCAIKVCVEGSLTAVKIVKDDVTYRHGRNTRLTKTTPVEVVNEAIKMLEEKFEDF